MSGLENFYSNMSQAVMLSEIDNGEISNWDAVTSNGDPDQAESWFNKYLSAYLKYTKKEKISDGIRIYLNNGSVASFNISGYHMHVIFITSSKEINNVSLGKNAFYFLFDNGKFGPYLYPYSSNGTTYTRDDLLNAPIYGCKIGNGIYCTALIQHDGRQFASDYPWW